VVQDVIARDLVLLTPGQVLVGRVRGASLEELETRSLAALAALPDWPANPRRTRRARLRLARELEHLGPLLHLLAQGVSEEVDDLRVHPPQRSPSFVHLELSYHLRGRRRRIQRSAATLEDAAIAALLSLYPSPGQL